MIKRLPRFEGSVGPKSDKEKSNARLVESAILSTWVVNKTNFDMRSHKRPLASQILSTYVPEYWLPQSAPSVAEV